MSLGVRADLLLARFVRNDGRHLTTSPLDEAGVPAKVTVAPSVPSAATDHQVIDCPLPLRV